MQEEVRSNLRRRTWRNALLRVFGCCGIYLVTLLMVPILFAYLVARTGIVEVPFLGGRVAHERLPSRTVVAASVDVGQLFTAKLRAVLPSGGAIPEQVTITLTESELTGLLRSALVADARASAVTRDTAQVAVAADGVEIFARVAGYGNRETTVLLRGVPSLQEGKLAAEFRAVAVGNLGVPRPIANAIARSFLPQLPPLQFGSDGPLPAFAVDRITLSDGAIHVTVKRTIRTP